MTTQRIEREPQIPTFTAYSTVAAVKTVLRDLDGGSFANAALLVEQMLQNPRMRGPVETRLNGLVGTPIRWEAAKQNSAGRRAAKAIVEDWPWIAPQPMRKQLHTWGILGPVGLAQKRWFRAPRSSRWVPRVEVYHPTFLRWDWQSRAYVVQIDGGRQTSIQSPSLTAPDERSDSPWVVHEPFGQHSWRWGLVFSAWSAWLGHEWNRRDANRASEKFGIGVVKAIVPWNNNQKAVNTDFARGLRNLNSEAVITCPEQEDGRKYDVQPLEFSAGNGYEIIDRTRNTNAIDLAILLLGHNLTSEAKGGSYAAANVGDLIRGDIRAADAAAESSTFRDQVLAEWAAENFGDPEVAPVAIYETDPPAVDQAAAQTLAALAQAVAQLRQDFPMLDFPALFARYRLPLLAEASKASEGAPEVQPSGDASAALATAPAASQAIQEITLALTPTDLATIVRVDEGRRSTGLEPVGGEVGGRWVAEHAAAIRLDAGLAPEPGAAAPTEDMPTDTPPAEEPAAPPPDDGAEDDQGTD